MEMASTWGSDARGRNKRIQGEVTAFRLWQVANLFGWDCTIIECAKAAGINEVNARKIARERGWTGRFNREALSQVRSDNARKMTSKRWQHTHSDALDVCDMMELG
jgi:hypothetical protein